MWSQNIRQTRTHWAHDRQHKSRSPNLMQIVVRLNVMQRECDALRLTSEPPTNQSRLPSHEKVINMHWHRNGRLDRRTHKMWLDCRKYLASSFMCDFVRSSIHLIPSIAHLASIKEWNIFANIVCSIIDSADTNKNEILFVSQCKKHIYSFFWKICNVCDFQFDSGRSSHRWIHRMS